MKKTKPPAFLICENPIAEKSDGRLFILHNRTPMMLAEVRHFENMSEADQLNFQRLHTTGSRLDYAPRTIYFTPIWVQENGLPTEPHKHAHLIAATLRRMADWYKSYLIWEDNDDEKEKGA